MLRSVSEFLDRCAIRSACRSVRCGPLEESRFEEAGALLERPDFFEGHAGRAAALKFTDSKRFLFPSSITTPSAENNVAHGKLFRVGPNWQNHPAVILLHGWNGEYGYRWQFPWLARKLVQAGLNAAMIELPYHGQRKPARDAAIRNFISHDLYSMLEATRQAIADIRALTLWLHEQSVPVVGLWGISMAAWLSSLVAVTEPLVRLAVLMAPVVRLDKAVAELPFCEPIRRSLQGRPFAWERLDPARYCPSAGPHGILLLQSTYDLFAETDCLGALRRAWGHPELWDLPHGHISVMASAPVMRRAVAWLKAKSTSERLAALPQP